jgi:LacI family transcriptional regulator
MSVPERRPKVADVAARAGVSAATVDRVINGRGGVHRKTVERVEGAIRQIIGADRPVTAPTLRFDALLSGDGGQATKSLAQALVGAGESLHAQVDVAFVETMNPAALAAQLRECAQRGTSGVAVQVLDHALVREAIEDLLRADIPVASVLTDIAGVDRLAYVGLDNRAAGRTAGFLMGRFCRRAGKLAVVWGGQLYRSHEERESGFRSILRAERPDLQCLEVITDNDNPAVTRGRVSAAIAAHPDLVGLYCVGGGVAGAAQAIEEAGLSQLLVMIGHNCNADTKPYLLSGTIEAVIHQDMARIADIALKCLTTKSGLNTGIPVEIVTRENVMYR